MNIIDAIEILRKHYGNHSNAAKAMGYTVGHYSHSRNINMSEKVRRTIMLHAELIRKK